MAVKKRYAKFEENGSLSVGIGTDTEFYKSIGMTEMEVEQGWDGRWYKAGKVPEKPQADINKERILELKDLLSASDYKCLKYVDGALTDEEYAEIKALRQAWRDEINELEKELSEKL